MVAAVGWLVGSFVGVAVGSFVGSAVGSFVGSAVGSFVGSAVGSLVGSAVGSLVGCAVGSAVGAAVGADVGVSLFVSNSCAEVATFVMRSIHQDCCDVSCSASRHLGQGVSANMVCSTRDTFMGDSTGTSIWRGQLYRCQPA